ncbi:MAG: 6-bladed beta-propeller [Magnetococcales bacterium]|nr:6-bladed beta-propeller [Magnetococcales bacterium]
MGKFRLHLLLFGLLSACAGQVEVANQADLFWPPLPEQPRYLFEAVLRSPKDLHAKEEKSLLKEVGVDKEPDRVFSKPVRLAARGGRLFVTDSVAHLVHVFDVPRRRYFRFGVRREGALTHPVGIAVDAEKRVYVVDAGKKRVVVYDELGLFLRFVGEEAGLIQPAGIAVHPLDGRIFVTDHGPPGSSVHRVVIFAPDGRLLGDLARAGREAGQLLIPTDVAVAGDGVIYVLDAGNFRVQAFSSEGLFLRQWGGVGRSLGQFARPRALAVDAEGLVYVLDGSFCNLQVFSPQGELLLPIGECRAEEKPGAFASPSGVAIDETNRVYVVDQVHLKISVLRKLSEQQGREAMSRAAGK